MKFYWLGILLFSLNWASAQCDFYEDIIGLTMSGFTTGDNTQEYVLVDNTGNISQINSTPDFLGLTAGNYNLYGINYEGSLPSEITVGQPWSGTSAIVSCFDASSAYNTTVCDTPVAATPCEFVNDITGLSVAGATAGDNTQEYVLVFIATDEILQISNVPDFFNLNGGDYIVYGINYEGVRPSEITIGNLWAGTSSIASCYDATNPYVTNVCEDVCENQNLTITTVGFTNSGSFSQNYILVDTDANEILSSNTTGVFNFSLYVAMDNLEIYALNTEDAVLLAMVSDGATWSTIETAIATATCADLLGPRNFTVLAETSPSCCSSDRGFVR